MNKLTMFAPFAKVNTTDDGGREVWGFATLERKDKADEIADFEGTLEAFKVWSEEIQKNTQGKSKGNVRVMHQPITGGSVIDWQPGETTIVEGGEEKTVKGIWVGSYVPPHKEDVIKDIDSGILSAYSIGGSYAKKWLDPSAGAVRFIPRMSELSLVDNPAVPGAEFQLVKADTGPWDKAEGGEHIDGTDKNQILNKSNEGSEESVTAEQLAKAAQAAGINVEQMTALFAELSKVETPPVTNVDGDGDKDNNQEFPKPDDQATPPGEAENGEKQNEDGIKKDDDVTEVAKDDVEEMAKAHMSGSYEELQSMLRSAVNNGWNWRYIVATFPDHVIVEDYDADKYYSVPYTLENGAVKLGDAQEVEQDFKPVQKGMHSVLTGLELAKSGAAISEKNREKLHKAASHIHDTCSCDKCMKAASIYAGEDGTNNGEEAQEPPIKKSMLSDMQKAVGFSFAEELQKAGFVKSDDLQKFQSEVSEMAKAVSSVSSTLESVSKSVASVDKRVEEFAKSADERLKVIEEAPVSGGPLLFGATGDVGGVNKSAEVTTEYEILNKAFETTTDPNMKDMLGRRLAVLERKNQR